MSFVDAREASEGVCPAFSVNPVVVSRSFALGERVSFTHTELIQLQYSMMVFVNSLVLSNEEFAKGVGYVLEAPVAAT